MTDNCWKPELYRDRHSFVWQLGSSVVELLDPKSAERILDVGCGTGELTARIADSGAEVVGLDNSPEMIQEARRLYPDLEFQAGDAHDFDFDKPFDAVFSNAALHWIKDPEKVVLCMSRALRPSGRLAVEFGGQGNVTHVVRAIERACHLTIGTPLTHPWYFPSIAQFASLLERHGIQVTQAALIDRPTPLEGEDGLRQWVCMFGDHWLNRVPAERRDEFFEHIESMSRSELYWNDLWHADYRRLRVKAFKTVS